MSATASRIIKNTGWLYAKMGITMFISLYTTRLILQGLGASDFGIYNIVGGAIGMLGFLNSTMSNATQRFMNYTEGEGNLEKKKVIFNVSTLLHYAIAAAMVTLLIIASFFFFEGVLNIPSDRMNAAYVVYGSLIISTAYTITSVPYDAVLISHENLKYYALISILESVLKLLVAFACVYTCSDRLILYGILMACIPILLRTIMRIYCHRRYEECVFGFRRFFDRQVLNSMMGFAGWNFLTAMTSLLSQNGLGIVLNHFFGTVLNAAQGIANQLAGYINTISSNASKAINPVLTKSEGAKDRNMVFYLISVGSRVNYLLYAIFALPAIVYAPIILKYWLTAVPDWAVVFCQLQLVRSLVSHLCGNLASAVYAQGDIKNYAIIKSITNILPLLLVYWAFSNDYPPYSMYLIWILCWEVLGGVTIMYYAKKQIGLSLRFYSKEMLVPCALISAGSIALLYFVQNQSSLLINLVGITLYFILFIILSWILALQKKEKTMIVSLILRYAKH